MERYTWTLRVSTARKVYVASIAVEEEVQRVWREMLDKSPLVRTFQPAIRFELSLQVVL